ncbi:dihydroneopterin aldolase [Roseivirga seohaensis]|uniref:dihydroneopterin aldolase n=1 Tax=Roseivirga seohaensis TaxID=1914963 RepID=UPI003BADA8AE
MNTDKVALEGMEFYAYHGFYEEERKIGNRYSVDIEVTTNFEKAAQQDDLSGTVDYVQLYEIVKNRMASPAKLLEKLGQDIIDSVFATFSSVAQVKVSVSKHNPPFGGICAKSKITLERIRS